MSGGDAPPCEKNCPSCEGGDDELLVGDAVAVVVGMFMTDMVGLIAGRQYA